jgi:hypothetical protein
MKYNRPDATKVSPCGRFEYCNAPIVRYRSGHAPARYLVGDVTFALALVSSALVAFTFFVHSVNADTDSIDDQEQVR